MQTNISSVSTNGYEMSYFSFGTGETPLVMLPGISVKDVTTLADAVAMAYARFAERFTVYVFDRRSNIPRGYGIGDTAIDTAAALDRLEIRKACVFGVSMGGMTAQQLAVNRHDLVERLVLSSTASRIPQQAKELLSKIHRLAKDGKKDALALTFAEAVYSPSFFEKYRPAILALLSDCTQAELDKFAALTEGIVKFDIYDSLDKIACPLLVIGAGEDKLLGTQSSIEIAKKTGAELYIYEGYGHAAYDEAPDYKDRLFEFFTRQEG